MEEKKTKKEILTEAMMSFFISTACICILEGVIGLFFFEDAPLHYGAFFSPPLFGLFSAIVGLVLKIYTNYKLSMTQLIIRKLLHLFLIETAVLGLNVLFGKGFTLQLAVVIFISVAFIYVIVNAVMYMNDRRNADQFNRELRDFQENIWKRQNQ